MSRIIFVPQYPTKMRYQEWWWWKFPEEFAKAGFDVLILGASEAAMLKENASSDMFSPINAAISLECAQIEQYMNTVILRDDDILFMADLSFPGLFGNVLFHKRPKRCFAYCHATSMNYLDYFEKDRHCKFPIESSHAYLMDAVFVGSDYHDSKLRWEKNIVVRLPYPPLKTFHTDRKTNLIVSASRNNPQKVDIDLECRIEDRLHYPIVRESHNSWEDYYKFLSKSRILLITSFEDTFGYQIVDAVMNDCIPLAPTRCAYSEILPKEYLYKDEDELIRKMDYLINSDHGVPYLSDSPYEVPVPKLLCDKEMKDFYSNIIQVMKGEPDYPF